MAIAIQSINTPGQSPAQIEAAQNLARQADADGNGILTVQEIDSFAMKVGAVDPQQQSLLDGLRRAAQAGVSTSPQSAPATAPPPAGDCANGQCGQSQTTQPQQQSECQGGNCGGKGGGGFLGFFGSIFEGIGYFFKRLFGGG